MTVSCPSCECIDTQMTDDNGAEYPETRVEFYECADCGESFRQVLSA